MPGVMARLRRQPRIVTGEACPHPHRQDHEGPRPSATPSRHGGSGARDAGGQRRDAGTGNGAPPRLIRTPDGCELFHAHADARLPGLVAREGQAGRDPSTPETRLIRQTGPRLAPPTIGETRMRSPTDHVHEEPDHTAPPPTDARGLEGTMDAPPETEASFEEIER